MGFSTRAGARAVHEAMRGRLMTDGSLGARPPRQPCLFVRSQKRGGNKSLSPGRTKRERSAPREAPEIGVFQIT